MSTFTIPPGDPGALRELAGRITGQATTVGQTRPAAIRSAAEQVEPALPVARVHDFAAARKELTDTAQAVALDLAGISAAVGTWADALAEAQTQIGAADRAHDSAERSWRVARSAGETELAQEHQREMSRQAGLAETAQSQLRRSAQVVSARLSEHVEAWVPGGSALSGVQAWQAAASQLSPPATTLDAQALAAAYQQPDPQLVLGGVAVSKAITAGTKGFQAWQVGNYLMTGPLALRAERNYLEAAAAYQALKGSAPDLRQAMTYNEYIRAERAVLAAYRGTKDLPVDALKAQNAYRLLRGYQGESQALKNLRALYPGLSAAEVTGTAGRFEPLLRPVRVVGPIAAKVLGPVSMGLGAWDAYQGITDTSMPTDQRVAHAVGGTATFVSGGAATLVAFGLVSTVAAPVVIGVAAVAGVIAVGAWAYENREAIGHAAEKVGGAIKSGVGKVWKGLFG